MNWKSVASLIGIGVAATLSVEIVVWFLAR